MQHSWEKSSSGRLSRRHEAVPGGENLTGISFCPKLFAEEEPEGPGRLLYRDGFSTILHLLLGSPRPAATTLHAELCQPGGSQGLSLCESLRPPCTGARGTISTRTRICSEH